VKESGLHFSIFFESLRDFPNGIMAWHEGGQDCKPMVGWKSSAS
jgi:hypothetical protein